MSQRELKPFEMYIFIAVLYWVCTYSMSKFAQWLEVRMSRERTFENPARPEIFFSQFAQ